MSLNFKFDHDVETVANLLADPDFLVERSLAMGELDASAEVDGTDEEYTVSMTRRVKQDLPAVLAKMFNTEQEMQMTETWRWDQDGYTGDYKVTVEGQPVVVSAQFSLKPDGDGSVYSISHSAKAKIPLVGGKVEKFILGQTTDGAMAELNFAKAQLG